MSKITSTVITNQKDIRTPAFGTKSSSTCAVTDLDIIKRGNQLNHNSSGYWITYWFSYRKELTNQDLKSVFPKDMVPCITFELISHTADLY